MSATHFVKRPALGEFIGIFIELFVTVCMIAAVTPTALIAGYFGTSNMPARIMIVIGLVLFGCLCVLSPWVMLGIYVTVSIVTLLIMAAAVLNTWNRAFG